MINDPKVNAVFKACTTKVSSRGSYFDLADGDWEIFKRTFGWYQVSKELSEEQQASVKSLWDARRKKVCLP